MTAQLKELNLFYYTVQNENIIYLFITTVDWKGTLTISLNK